MLVLSRKPSQHIVIDDHIRINILRINSSSVRIGIEAPREVSIRRGELKAHPRQGTSMSEEVTTSMSFEDTTDSVTVTCSNCHS